jgi:hypothetical protein
LGINNLKDLKKEDLFERAFRFRPEEESNPGGPAFSPEFSGLPVPCSPFLFTLSKGEQDYLKVVVA